MKKILISPEVQKYCDKDKYYDSERFVSDAKRYIKAIQENRVICSIGSVSNSGMSRTIKFLAPEKNKDLGRYQYYNFFAFFKSLGYSPVKESDYFRINGCGMDMIFHTNYSIIHSLERMSFINRSQCDTLAQMTPTVI